MKPSSLLWRLEREDAPGASFLFGTMHVRDGRAFADLEPVYAAIDACDAFAVEFNLAEAEGEDIASLLQLPEGQTLEQLAGARQYDRLQRTLRKSLGLDIRQAPNILPFALMNMADSALFATDNPVALDEHLWQFAKRGSKQLHGLETLQEQIEVLQKIPLQYQLRAVLQLGRNMPAHRRQMRRMTDLYVQGNIRQLYQSARKTLGPFRKPMLFDRNRIMAQRFHRLAGQTTLFAAVGAAHLAGAYGLLRLLKQNGWRVRAV
jgi:uncharacterized protein